MGRRYDRITETFYNGQWNDISGRVHNADPVTISRASPPEQDNPSPSTMTLTLQNMDRHTGVVDHMFSGRDPRSPLYGLIGQNTPIRHGIRLHHTTGAWADTLDAFDRTVGAGWGTAPNGLPWSSTQSGGATTTSSVSGGVGVHTVSTTNAYRITWLNDLNTESVTVAATFTCPLATGAPLEPCNIALRGTDINHYVLARVQALTTNLFSLQLLDAAGALIGTVATAKPHTGTARRLRVRCAGQHVMMRLWDPTGPEPSTWDAVFVDPAVPVSGFVGIRSGVAGGNTNVPPVTFTYDNVEIIPESTRFCGEMAQSPPKRDVSGRVELVEVEAAGILRRLGQSRRQLKSALHRYLATHPNVKAYYPLDEGKSVSSWSDVFGHPPLVRVDGAGSELASGEEVAPWLGTGIRASTVNVRTATWGSPVAPGAFGAMTFLFVARLMDPTSSLNLVLLPVTPPSSSAAAQVTYSREAAPFVPNVLGVDVVNLVGNLQESHPEISALEDTPLLWALRMENSGSDVAWTLHVHSPSREVMTLAFVHTGGVVPSVNGLYFWANAGDLVVSDIAVANALIDETELVDAFRGHRGETAGSRFLRLCAEEGVPAAIVGGSADTPAMGPQHPGRLLDLLAECVGADAGILSEPRSHLGVTMRTRRSLYSQTPALSLDAATGVIDPTWEPMPDDAGLTNDVTVKRRNGAEARAVLETGPLSIQDPPAGVGSGYEASPELNLATDTQLLPQARWRLHTGTSTDPRYTNIPVRLENLRVLANPALQIAALAVDPGDVVEVLHAPDTPDPVRQISRGFVETGDNDRHSIACSGTPARPYNVGVYGSASTRRDTATSIAAVFDAGLDTELITSGAIWSATAVPYVVQAAGVQLRVTSVVAGTHLFVDQEPVNGVHKTIPGGSRVSLAEPSYYGPGG